MMLLRLNLISPEKKAKFTSLVRFLFIKETLELVILTCAFLAIVHIMGWIVLTGLLSDLARSSVLISNDVPPVNREIRTLNRQTRDVTFSGKGFEPLLPKLLELTQTLPPAIKLNTLNLDRQAGTVQLVGVAQTRADLLAYQKTIAAIAWIDKSTYPTSQLFQKENINFEMRGTLKNATPPVKPAPTRAPTVVNE